MARSPRRRRFGLALGALVCAAAATGCQTHTIPWEHPTAFNRTPACDSPGPCGDGCYVPPPPMLDSDCYGYRFTCWHPWPEHCQPQCQNGCEQPYTTVVPHTPPAMPETMPETMPEAIPETMPETAPTSPSTPAMPPAMPPEETSFAPPATSTTQNFVRGGPTRASEFREPPSYARYAPARRDTAVSPNGNWSRGTPSPPTTIRPDAAANYGFISAVAQSGGAIYDEAVRPASRVTRLYAPGTGPDDPPTELRTPQSSDERFRW